MKLAKTLNKRTYRVAGSLVILTILLAYWKPYVLIEGIQRSCLYAAIALPMALTMGVVGIINLAHGDFMMLGSYFAYWLYVRAGVDPLLAWLPALLVFYGLGVLCFKATIKRVLHVPLLNQLLLTFGLFMVLEQSANLLWTSRALKVHLKYSSASLTIGSLSFGTFEFVYVAAAVVLLSGLLLFLKRTRIGQAALAVGQNPRGAKLVGIHVDHIYLVVFSLSIALVGAMGPLFIVRHSIHPFVGMALTFKSFCLIAMAGIGNILGILWASLILGLTENFVLSFMGYAGWADIIFFALIVGVILVKSHQREVK